jgi:ribosomal protein L33
MFVVFGTKTRKKKVNGGIVREKYCPECGRVQMFEEVRWINHFSLFFVPVFPIQSSKSAKTVLACPECDASFWI